MKILIDLTSLADNFSGIERFALSITQEMLKCTENEYLLVFKNEVHKDFLNTSKCIKKVVIKGKNKLIFAQVILPIKLWTLNADVYFFPAFPQPVLFFSKKSISTIHDLGCWDCPHTDKRLMIWYYKILYRKAAMFEKKIITVSSFSKERIIDLLHVSPQNICVAYNGLSDLFTKANYDQLEDSIVRKKYNLPKRYILCLSTIEPRKNMRLLIEAYSQLYEENRISYDLVLAGRKGWLVDELMSNLPTDVLSHIHFTGFVANEHLPYIYKNAKYFVFPSIYEGFGIPPIEAMSQGSLVLSSNVTSMPEILGENAIYFKNNDIEDLKRQMQYMDTLPDSIIRELSNKGKQHALRYRWDVSAHRILSFFRN